MNSKKIRVLVVDDSPIVRHAIVHALGRDPEIEVVGTAADPYEARDKILDLNPDVLTLDIDMPRMDGITFLRILQKHRPLPVIVVSALSPIGSRAAIDALEAGAVDVMDKPGGLSYLGPLLCEKVKGAALATLRPKAAADAPRPSTAGLAGGTSFNPQQLILIGSSTGGTEALKSLLSRLPDGLPGICIVQHIPPIFSKALAQHLNEYSALEVREAVFGDEIRPGLALIAPGDYHMTVAWDSGRYRVVLNQAPPVHFTRPSVDILFNSAVACAGRHATVALLTGMGSDGAEGMKRLRTAGATTFAQDEATCVVYGMPRAAVALGAVDQVLPLDGIPDALVRSALSKRSQARPTGPLQQTPR